MVKLSISPNAIKENKEIVEDLILAAHGDAKKKLQTKTSEEISKVTGGIEFTSLDLNFLIEEKNG